MKHSIKNVFDNIFVHAMFIFLFSIFSILILLDSTLSMKKTTILSNQKNTISSLTELKVDNYEIARIEFKGASTQLVNDIQKLQNLYKYNFIEKLLINDTKEYQNQLLKLQEDIKTFNINAYNYLFNNKDKTNEMIEQNVKSSYDELNKQIDSMLLQEIRYSQEKFSIKQFIMVLSFILILAFIIISRFRLNQIYKDILFLYSVESSQKHHTIVYEEIDAIALRMKKKPVNFDNPDFFDKVTNLYNNQGLVYNYKNKKSMHDDNPIALVVFEIDNFSRANRKYSQETLQAILKKVAYTFSLYQQPTDIMARTDFNQFTIILVRSTRGELFEEVEKMRQNISELNFNIPNVGPVNITVTGGFSFKTNKMHFEDLIKNATKTMKLAQSTGTNKIFQERDVTMRENMQ